jgi:beta-lactamase regulating signal transducer with metallopeptidase domain
MTIAAVLLAYAAIAGWLSPRLLSRASGPVAHPMRTALMLTALSCSAVLAVGLAGVVLVLPLHPLPTTVDQILCACGDTVTAHYTTPLGLANTGIGALTIILLAVRAVHRAVPAAAALRRDRERHRTTLRLLASHDPTLDAYIVRDRCPTAYCVPGRRGPVVVTTGALDALDDDELHAVLAHERAHLREHHGLLVTINQLLHHMFGLVPAIRVSSQQVPALVELAADDTATRRHDPLQLASALVTLAAHEPGHQPRLAAARLAVEARFARLLSHPARHRTPKIVLAVVVLATLAIPMALAVTPAISALIVHYCPAAHP